jgi:predicted CopG family antitoxin
MKRIWLSDDVYELILRSKGNRSFSEFIKEEILDMSKNKKEGKEKRK